MALAAVAALGLASCGGGLSMESPVQPGLEVGSVQENDVRVLPPGPTPGSTPEQVVAGFIRAGAASDEEYDVARSFLTSTPGATWRPDSSVVVFSAFDSALTIERSGDDRVTATATATARIDGAGRFRELPTGSIVQTTFRLQKTDGQWRISQIPEAFGTWLSQADLDRLYDPFRIYYVSTAERRLVPDVRWFAQSKGLATRLARAQLGAVPDYLQGALRTEVPEGTRLAVDAVPIDSGLASVDLTATRPTTNPTQRQNLWAQFLATLTQAPGVDRITLRVEGSELQVPGVETSAGSLTDLGFSTPASGLSVKPVLRNGSTLRHIDPEQVGDPVRPGPQKAGALPSIEPGWVWLAMSRNGEEIAGVGGDRAELSRWRGVTQIRVPYFGSALTKPSYDRQDVLWVGGRDARDTRLWAINTAADPNDTTKTRPQVVAAEWLSGRSIISLSVAPDGQRLAVVSTDAQGGDPRVDVAGVLRQPNGLPSSLARPLAVAPALSLVRDLVWVDESTLSVLGRKTDQEVIRPWFVPLGGPMTAGTELAGARWITTINGERGLVITTDDGDVYVRAGSRWLPVGEGTDFLVPAR